MIPLRPDLLRDLDQRNRALHEDQVLTERIRGLVRDYLAPAPNDGAGVVGIPVPAAVPPPHRWRPAVGRAPAATTYADGPTSVGRPGGGGTASRPHPSTSPTGIGGTGRGGRMGRPSRPLP